MTEAQLLEDIHHPISSSGRQGECSTNDIRSLVSTESPPGQVLTVVSLLTNLAHQNIGPGGGLSSLENAPSEGSVFHNEDGLHRMQEGEGKGIIPI